MKKKNKKAEETQPEKRIYCVLANKVQAPLMYDALRRTKDTRTIRQPAGRLVAQAAHVVSRVRDMMTKKHVVENWGKLNKDSLFFEHYCEPVTTIVLACRDSFELDHIFGLLEDAGIPVVHFMDTNQPDYGSSSYEVRTAIATEPVLPNEVVGILDYLPLWKPKKFRRKREKHA